MKRYAARSASPRLLDMLLTRGFNKTLEHLCTLSAFSVLSTD